LFSNSRMFTVEVTNATSSQLSIKLIDIQGHTVYSKSIESALGYKETIKENLSKGIYFIILETKTGIKTQKLIIR
ncbi:MAG: T9SS type A sorting domain-containing protein, partial [Bacteroidota bacterium]|nr:T9SS type A sorting domain-containing protein [Bacteroidota bacterium]